MIEKPTKEWFREEAHGVAQNTLDDITFYMAEYGEAFSYLEIAEIFSDVFNKMIKSVAEEMKEMEEVEEDF